MTKKEFCQGQIFELSLRFLEVITGSDPPDIMSSQAWDFLSAVIAQGKRARRLLRDVPRKD